MVLENGRNASVATIKPLFCSVAVRKPDMSLKGIGVVMTICLTEEFRKYNKTENDMFSFTLI